MTRARKKGHPQAISKTDSDC